MRKDAHSPKNFDPADYRVIDYLDNKKPEPPRGPFNSNEEMHAAFDAYEAYAARWREMIFEHFPDWRTGGDDHKSIFECNHCGHPAIRYIAVVEHIPTGARLAFGEICADRTELAGRDEFRKKFVFDKAKRELAAYEKQQIRVRFKATNPELVEWLESVTADPGAQRKPPHEFVISLADQLRTRGELSERQVTAANKFLAREQEWQARRQAESDAMSDVAPVAEGRRQIVGEIVSTKWQDSDYNMGCLKMLVREPDGNKLWGTVPRSIDYYLVCAEPKRLDTLVGQKVTFTAEVKRSDKDPHFGVLKRPASAKLAA